MNKLILEILLVLCVFAAISTDVKANDYTQRTYTLNACKLFARDAYLAANNLHKGMQRMDLLSFIYQSTVSPNEKNRASQAIDFVWDNQLDNPLMAYTLAMGTCLTPKDNKAPIDEPWVVSPRTSREYF